MIQVNNITTDPLQNQTLILPSGESFSITMYYVPMQYCWFITNLTYQTFTLNYLKIVTNPNLLYQWQNILPFGLACFSPSQREPSLQADFFSGASNLFVLTQQEVQEYTTYIEGGSLPS